MRRYIELLNEMRQKDGHLQGILGQGEEAIAELPWTLHLPENAKARDKRVAAWVEQALRNAKGVSDEVTSFDALIAHLTTSFYHGHDVGETMWVKDEKGRLVPKGWMLHDARRFGYAEDGRFVHRDDGKPDLDLRAAFPGKFVISQPRVNGDLPCREGLGRPLLWAALFRNWDMTDWLRTAELAWKPWRLGYYNKDASDDDVAALKETLQSLVTTGSAVLADTTQFKAEWPGGSGGTTKPTHSELYNVLAQEMSKAALGSTETVQSSTSSGFAQAKVHDKVSMRVVRSRAKQLASFITRDLIRWMVILNFGPEIAIPEFRFVIEESVDIAAFGKGVKDLVTAGAKLPQNWVRARIGCPAPKGDEEILEMSKAAAPSPKDSGDGESDDEGDGGEDEDEADPKDPSPSGDEDDNADDAADEGDSEE